MPRTARQKSETGIYHVMVRGINREIVFREDEDRLRYLTTLERYARLAQLTIFGFCLMTNHLHLLLAEGEEPLGETMRRLGTSYVVWYNEKYKRVGHLFQDRFLSEPVEGDEYFLAALRYIHQNPLQAGLTESCTYRWSSYADYTEANGAVPGLVDTSMALGLLGNTQGFIDFTNSPGRMDLCDLDEPRFRVVDSVVAEQLHRLLIDRDLQRLQDASLVDRTQIIQELKTMKGTNVRQIARVTGLSKSTIGNA